MAKKMEITIQGLWFRVFWKFGDWEVCKWIVERSAFILLVARCFEFQCTESHGMYLQLHSFMGYVTYQLEASHYEAVGNWSSRQCYLLLLLFLLLLLLLLYYLYYYYH